MKGSQKTSVDYSVIYNKIDGYFKNDHAFTNERFIEILSDLFDCGDDHTKSYKDLKSLLIKNKPLLLKAISEYKNLDKKIWFLEKAAQQGDRNLIYQAITHHRHPQLFKSPSKTNSLKIIEAGLERLTTKKNIQEIIDELSKSLQSKKGQINKTNKTIQSELGETPYSMDRLVALIEESSKNELIEKIQKGLISTPYSVQELLSLIFSFIKDEPLSKNKFQGYFSTIEKLNKDNIDFNLLDTSSPSFSLEHFFKMLESNIEYECHKKILDDIRQISSEIKAKKKDELKIEFLNMTLSPNPHSDDRSIQTILPWLMAEFFPDDKKYKEKAEIIYEVRDVHPKSIEHFVRHPWVFSHKENLLENLLKNSDFQSLDETTKLKFLECCLDKNSGNETTILAKIFQQLNTEVFVNFTQGFISNENDKTTKNHLEKLLKQLKSKLSITKSNNIKISTTFTMLSPKEVKDRKEKENSFDDKVLEL